VLVSAEAAVGAPTDLDGRERDVVCLRFGLEDDEPRARQIERRAGEKPRRPVTLRSHLN
jgi:DNA-directed RNA polymerase sigma subunit (sigma70/sigma32)